MFSWHVLRCLRRTAGGHRCVARGHLQATENIPNVRMASVSSMELSVSRL